MYESQIATAARLVAKYGQPAIWVQTVIPPPGDPTKPWIRSAGVPTDFPCSVVFITSNKKNWYAQIFDKASDIPDGFLMALLPGNCGFVPTLTDQLKRSNTVSYFVKWIDEVNPAGNPILYTLGLAP
jgi:hypothetical protein